MADNFVSTGKSYGTPPSRWASLGAAMAEGFQRRQAIQQAEKMKIDEEARKFEYNKQLQTLDNDSALAHALLQSPHYRAATKDTPGAIKLKVSGQDVWIAGAENSTAKQEKIEAFNELLQNAHDYAEQQVENNDLGVDPYESVEERDNDRKRYIREKLDNTINPLTGSYFSDEEMSQAYQSDLHRYKSLQEIASSRGPEFGVWKPPDEKVKGKTVSYPWRIDTWEKIAEYDKELKGKAQMDTQGIPSQYKSLFESNAPEKPLTTAGGLGKLGRSIPTFAVKGAVGLQPWASATHTNFNRSLFGLEDVIPEAKTQSPVEWGDEVIKAGLDAPGISSNVFNMGLQMMNQRRNKARAAEFLKNNPEANSIMTPDQFGEAAGGL